MQSIGAKRAAFAFDGAGGIADRDALPSPGAPFHPAREANASASADANIVCRRTTQQSALDEASVTRQGHERGSAERGSDRRRGRRSGGGAMDMIDRGISLPEAPVNDRVTVAAAASRLGLSRATISGWIGRGLLPAEVVDGRRRVRLANLGAAQAQIHAGVIVPAWRREPRRAGWRLRCLRETAGLTQIELAARSGLTHEAISNLERGRRTPLATTVRALAHALGVDPTAFVGGAAAEPGLTTAEAAARLGVPAARVQTWLLDGQLVGWKVAGQWRVSRESLAALEASGRMRGRSRRLDPRFRG
jgi:excisionase family DNA binding protein